jgi:hypothetical protein
MRHTFTSAPNLRPLAIIWLLLMVGPCLVAQPEQDTAALFLHPEVLKEPDVLSFKKNKSAYTFHSGNRTEERFDELPYSTWVITAEEIQRYGMLTLVDVLRAAPGIRVSQPGNAMEGETFMMRGLAGNQYVKILINDVPIKPSAALGLPIGAQLPIQQAERIEILYGTTGGIMYGNEACAGVVNIILKETERPIFTQADLSFGTQNFNNLDIMFGGRLFKNKNIVRFSLFGSSTVRKNKDIYWDKDVYRLDNYFVGNMTGSDLRMPRLYQSLSNEDLFSATRDSFLSVTPPLPHESRMFGTNLDWRGLRFGYYRMERSDAASLGSNPLAYSYLTQGNFFRDVINVTYVRASLKRKRFTGNGTLSFHRYTVDENSIASPIFDQKSILHYYYYDLESNDQTSRINDILTYYTLYNDGPRYYYGRDIAIKLDLNSRLRIGRHFFWHNSLFTQTGSAEAPYGHSPRPGNTRLIFDYDIRATPTDWLIPMSQIEMKTKRWTATLGTSISPETFNPRFAVGYKMDSSSFVFLNASIASKLFSVFEGTHRYRFRFPPSSPIPRIVGINADFARNNLVQKLYGFEFGIKRRLSELVAFHSFAYNNFQSTFSNNETGYRQIKQGNGIYEPPAFRVTGLQLRLAQLNSNHVNDKTITGKNEIFVQYTYGREMVGSNDSLANGIRNYPKWMFQYRGSSNIGRLSMSMAFNYQSKVTSKSGLWSQNWQRRANRLEYPGFSTLDLSLRFFLNRNFVAYIHTRNLFNRKTYGIDASGSPDDLLAPLQQRRQIRLGITYNMN